MRLTQPDVDRELKELLREEISREERPAWWDHPRLFAWCAFLLAIALATVAGIASLPGCATAAQADGVVGTAQARIVDLRAREKTATDKGDPAAATLRAQRERLEAQVAAVTAAAADDKPSPTETAAGTAAALIPGGVGVAITAGIGIIGHLVRSRALAERVSELRATLEHADDTTDNIVQSIEAAKQTNPAFAAEFARSAPLIRARQTSAARKRVNASQLRQRATVAAAIKSGELQDRPGPETFEGMGGKFPAVVPTAIPTPTPTPASPHAQAASA